VDIEVLQELLSLAGVLAGDDRNLFAEHSQSAHGDVFEVADGSGNKIKSAGQAIQSVAFGCFVMQPCILKTGLAGGRKQGK
jgi:hypothetical protein